MGKEDFSLPALGYVYLAGILVMGIFLFGYGMNYGLTAESEAALGFFIILAIVGLIWIQSHAPMGEVLKDREVTAKELAGFKEKPKMWIYLRIMCGLMGMGIGAGAVVLLYVLQSPWGSRHHPAGNSIVPDFQTYLIFTGITMVIGFILFYLIGQFLIFKKQPEGK
jgi:hypothetical protein